MHSQHFNQDACNFEQGNHNDLFDHPLIFGYYLTNQFFTIPVYWFTKKPVSRMRDGDR